MSELRNDASTTALSTRYLVGIDLGTTNCAMAYFDSLESKAGIQSVAIPQWDSEDTTSDSTVLPSFCYLPPKTEVKRRRFAMPWHKETEEPEEVVGRLAANLAIINPGRVIHSAKSWLCHRTVDREERTLPWNSDEVIGSKRRSPVEASAAYLRHLRQSWNQQFASHQEQYRLENQKVTITVPASFDESAQRLTLSAAELAGFKIENLRLLEEPQAAFYHLLSAIDHDKAGEGLAGQLPAITERDQTVLICDIGGGTTDFSLFRIDRHRGGEGLPTIHRIAVSDHILLGGDNIDLKIAAVLEEKVAKKSGKPLTSSQWAFLLGQARSLKEKALSVDSANDDEFRIAIPGTSSGLFATTVTVGLRRSEISELVADGFYPTCDRDAQPETDRSGLQEWNLPYAVDSGITRHLASFIRGHHIDAVLYTGGSLKPVFLRERLTGLLEAWQGGPVTVLYNDDLDLAVSRGSAAFTRAVELGRQQIQGGYPRSLYIEVQNADGKNALLCIVPKGFDSHAPLEISGVDLRVRIGEPVTFNLFAATRRASDKAAELISRSTEGISHLPSLQTRLEPRTQTKGQYAPVAVGLRVHLEHTGLLQIACFDKQSSQSWTLEFNLRDKAVQDTAGVQSYACGTGRPAQSLEKAIEKIDTYYGRKKDVDADEQGPGQLIHELESTLGQERSSWDLPTLRGMWPALKEGVNRRGRSLSHESTWLNLAGYLLRPGFGSDADPFRIADLWSIFQQGPLHGSETRIKNQWWIMWRRVAGGMSKLQQEMIFAKIIPTIRKGNEATAEMYMLAGSLELVDMEKKIQFGKLLVEQIATGRHHCIDQKIWALARLASRVPFYGGPQSVIRPAFVEPWLRTLADLDCRKAPLRRLGNFFAQAGRMVSDREFDVSPALRQTLVEKLRECQASQEQIRTITEFVPSSSESQSALFGESLPVGLFVV